MAIVQQVVWFEWKDVPELPTGGRWLLTSVHRTERPKRLWTLLRETDRNKQPQLPIVPAHLGNAYLEDYVHDWRMVGPGVIKYFTRVMNCGVWVLLEYEQP